MLPANLPFEIHLAVIVISLIAFLAVAHSYFKKPYEIVKDVDALNDLIKTAESPLKELLVNIRNNIEPAHSYMKNKYTGQEKDQHIDPTMHEYTTEQCELVSRHAKPLFTQPSRIMQIDTYKDAVFKEGQWAVTHSAGPVLLLSHLQ